MMHRRDALLGAMLATGGLLALSVRPDFKVPRQAQADLDIILARPLAGWRSQKPSAVITGSADELGASSYSQLAVRAFEPTNGPIITVLLAYGMARTYATQLHRPELCYPASGFKVLQLGDVILNLDDRPIPSRLMIAQRGERQDTVLYWTRVGTRFPTGLWEQRFQIARGVIAGDQSDELLARFSVTGAPGPETARLLNAFAASFIEAQTREGAALLLTAS